MSGLSVAPPSTDWPATHLVKVRVRAGDRVRVRMRVGDRFGFRARVRVKVRARARLRNGGRHTERVCLEAG